MALGDLYFDVLLKDKTDQGINAIKSKLSNLGANIDIKLNNTSIPKIDVTASLAIDRNKLIADVQDSLKSKQFTIDIKAKSNITTNANKSTLAYETEAQAKLIGAQARLLNAQNAQAVASAKAALAQAKLATEHQKTAREANRAQIEATKLARQRQMLANATNKATQSTRAFNNANRGAIGSLREMTGLAGKFSAIYMGGQFLSSLIKIRGEFEMQLVSLRAIMQSTERANELYGQLMQLSVISPFQFGDLVKYAKQLSAYQIPMGDLYDTTKRLADLSAGLGVGMDRLILAYGQVRSASVLRGTELRQFTEAGIPMVGALADKFSELEGRVVSAGEVFDKISGREVPFEMVKEVLEDLTSEGGMFFEMQEKQAATLQGQISNLKDAYAIMLNEIGQSTDGILKGGVGAIRWSLQNYQELLNILLSVVSAYGAYRIQLGYKTAIVGKDTMATLQNALAEKQRQASLLMQESYTRQLTAQEMELIATRTKLTQTDYEHLIATGQLNAAQVRNLYLTGKISKAQFQYLSSQAGMTAQLQAQTLKLGMMGRAWERLKLSLAGVGRAFKTLGATMMASWPMLLMGILTELIMQFSQLGEEQKRINQEIKENAKQNLAEIENFYKSHKVTFDALEMGSISEAEASKALEKTLEKIKQTAPSSALAFEAEIMMQDGSIKQLQKAHKILKAIEEYSYNAQDALNNIKINEDTLIWGAFGEGLAEDAQDFGDQLKAEIELATRQGWDVPNRVNRRLLGYNALSDELKEATSEIDKFIADNQGKLQGLTGEALRVEIAGLAKVLKEQYKEVDEYGSGILLNYFESKVGDFQSTFEYMASQLTNEERDALKRMKGQYSGQYKKEFDEIVQAVKERLGLIYLDTQDLVNNISQLQAVINVKLNIQTGEQLTGLQESLRSNIPLLGNEASYGRVMGWFKGESDYSKINGIIQNNMSSLKETIGNLKAQKVLSQAQQTQLKNAEEDLKTATVLANNIGVSTTKPTTSKGRSRGRGTTPVDQATLNLKEQYKKYRDFIADYEKLKKLVGSEKALTTLKSVTDFMPLFMGEGADEYINKILGDGGKIALVEGYLKKIQGKTSKEAKSFGEELGGALRDAQLEDFTDKFEEELKRIDEALEIDIANFQKWEKIMEQVGNKDMASLLAFGDASKVANSVVDLRKKYIEDISKETEGVTLTYEDLLGMDDDALKKLHEKVQEAFKETQEAISEEQYETNSKIAESIKNTMSIDEQVAQLEAEKDKLLKTINEGKGTDAEKDKMRSAVLADYAEKVTELKAKALELLPVWDKIFNAEDGSFGDITKALDYINEIDKNKVKVGETPEKKVLYTSEVGGEKIAFTSEELEKLKEAYKDLADAMADKNPFKSLNELFGLLNNKTDNLSDGEVLKLIAEDISTIATLGAEATGQLGDMFKAMGAEGAAEAMDWTKQALEGVANIATGFAEGGLIGGISATFGVVTGFLTSIFEKHDAKLKEQIEESKKVVAELQKEREEIERAIERGLGGAYGGTGRNAYTDLLEKMKKEQEEYKKQLEDAENIKNDEEREQTIADIEAEMAELDDQIRHFAEDTLKDLMDIDLKDWASQIGDSLVDAFANGEDAAAAFDKTVGDIIKNVVKNMASLYILEPLLRDLQVYLFGEDGKSGVFGSDKHFSEEDLKGMMPYLDAIKNEGVPAVEELFKGIDAGFGGLLSMSANMEGLSGGIKSITEDTANLLASYLNAVRADVALLAIANPRMTTIAESQLTQLTLIATNTSRSAVAVEAINNLLRSVTTTTSSGRVLKI